MKYRILQLKSYYENPFGYKMLDKEFEDGGR